MPVRCVGILTGGGDCPGLNAAIRAVVRPLVSRGVRVLGVEDGFGGLVEGRVRPLGDKEVSGILHLGGTIIGTTNRVDPFHYVEQDKEGHTGSVDASDRIHGNLSRLGIEALVIIGGDGTLAVSRRLAAQGVNIVSLPKTIDNDLPGTELTFGFHTAVQTATDAIDRIRTTGESHHRVMVVETMGRNAGWIALTAGLAGGGDVILIPEFPFTVSGVCDAVRYRVARDRRFSIVVVAEGACLLGGDQVVRERIPESPEPVRLGGIGQWVAQSVAACSGIESRWTVLGHLQRGGTPTAFDRVLATRYGVMAADLCLEGAFGRMVRLREERIESISLDEVPSGQRTVPKDSLLLRASREVGVSFGESTDKAV